MTTENSRTIIPPILTSRVEDAKDVAIARNTARRAGLLLGFSPAIRAQIASAVAALCEMILKTEERQTIHMHGLRSGAQTGIQITCEAPWLANVSRENALLALRSKLGEMMDEVAFEPGPPPQIQLVLWLLPQRMQPTS